MERGYAKTGWDFTEVTNQKRLEWVRGRYFGGVCPLILVRWHSEFIVEDFNELITFVVCEWHFIFK